jgi:hypothetical protein
LRSFALLALVVTGAGTGGVRAAYADVEDVRDLPPAGRHLAAEAELQVPCYLGACVRLGGELWLGERYRLAVALPLRLSTPDDAAGVDAFALGSASFELGARLAFGDAGATWLGAELGVSLPTGTSAAGTLDVRRFALAPWYFGSHNATTWLDVALGYTRRGQLAAARLGVLQDLEETEVNDGQRAYATRVRLGLEGGAHVTPLWLFEVGAFATASIAPHADYLFFADKDENVLAGAAYQLFGGLRASGVSEDLAFHLRIPFWQERGTGSPRPASSASFWVFLEVSGRLWF